MALPAYGSDVLQRRMQSGMTGTNQFSTPTQTGGPSPPPNFYQISPTRPGGNNGPGGGGNGGQDPNRDRLYNQNYSGAMFNPYAEVGQRQNNNPYPTPYPGIQVSPTGQVTGAEPVQAMQAAYPIEAGMSANAEAPSGGAGPTTQRTNRDRDRKKKGKDGGRREGDGGGDSKDGGGGGWNFNSGAFLQGGRDWKGYSDKQKKQLGHDSVLSEALRQLVSQGNIYQNQYNTNTQDARELFRRQKQDILSDRMDAYGGVEGNFASSGLGRGGAHLDTLADVTQGASRQLFDARKTKTDDLTQLLQDRQNAMAALEIERTNQRAEAIRRLGLENMEVSGLFGAT